MSDIKVYQLGEGPSPLEQRLAKETEILPCGHSVRQAQLLGCTQTACRPNDARISREYLLAVKARENGGR